MEYQLVLEFKEGTTFEDALAIMEEILVVWGKYLMATIEEESDK